MSEAGKVSLPTPERIEAIKSTLMIIQERDKYSMPIFLSAVSDYQDNSVKWIVELLDALEEAQQQAEKHRKVAEAKILFTNQGNNDYVYGLQEDLIEAQQTIARKREALRQVPLLFDMEAGDIFEIITDHINAALGNKEGETQP